MFEKIYKENMMKPEFKNFLHKRYNVERKKLLAEMGLGNGTKRGGGGTDLLFSACVFWPV